MFRGEDAESVISIAGDFTVGEERIPGDEEGCEIRSRTSGLSDASGIRACQSKQAGKVLSCLSFDKGECWRYMVDVKLMMSVLSRHDIRVENTDIGIQNCEQ